MNGMQCYDVSFDCTRMQALPNVKEYLQSDSCIKRPVNNTIAQWKQCLYVGDWHSNTMHTHGYIGREVYSTMHSINIIQYNLMALVMLSCSTYTQLCYVITLFGTIQAKWFSYLWQRLSVAVQQGNATAVVGTMGGHQLPLDFFSFLGGTECFPFDCFSLLIHIKICHTCTDIPLSFSIILYTYKYIYTYI